MPEAADAMRMMAWRYARWVAGGVAAVLSRHWVQPCEWAKGARVRTTAARVIRQRADDLIGRRPKERTGRAREIPWRASTRRRCPPEFDGFPDCARRRGRQRQR